jgi:hypothetical protein
MDKPAATPASEEKPKPASLEPGKVEVREDSIASLEVHRASRAKIDERRDSSH